MSCSASSRRERIASRVIPARLLRLCDLTVRFVFREVLLRDLGDFRCPGFVRRAFFSAIITLQKKWTALDGPSNHARTPTLAQVDPTVTVSYAQYSFSGSECDSHCGSTFVEPPPAATTTISSWTRRIDEMFTAWPLLNSRRMTAMLRTQVCLQPQGRRRLMRQTGIAALGPQPRTTEPSGRGSPFTMAGDRTRRSAAVRRWPSGGEGVERRIRQLGCGHCRLDKGAFAHMSTAPTATAANLQPDAIGGRNGRLDQEKCLPRRFENRHITHSDSGY